MGKASSYYILVPLDESKTKLSVPVDNPFTKARLHYLLKKEEASDIINQIPYLNTRWIDNDNLRKKEFSDLIKNGDRKETIVVLKSIREHENSLIGKARKLHAIDRQIYDDGIKLIVDEFSFLFGMKKADFYTELTRILDKSLEQ
jgi:CarD family transcriptional regulator